MFGMTVLNVAIGLVFVYLLLGILCTFINEWIARLFSLRSRNLKRGLKQLLADPNMNGLAKDVLEHSLIRGSADPKKGPSYITPETFARVLVDIIDHKSAGAAKAAKVGNDVKAALDEAHLPPEVNAVMTGLIDSVDSGIDQLRNNLQTWFDGSMERVSGWYKRRLQTISFVVAVMLAFGFNADTIEIGQALWQDPILRTQIANEAAVAVEACGDTKRPEECTYLQDTYKIRAQMERLPVGWWDADNGDSNMGSWVTKIIGLLITALAVSLGAPFWFDVLDKLNSIRSAGKKPNTAVENS